MAKSNIYFSPTSENPCLRRQALGFSVWYVLARLNNRTISCSILIENITELNSKT
jgi:hypothetical protein